ncbi:MAG: PASTA domain-containing protein [Deltaproteobacteria bacterium]|jgi:cell division protein FtsI (penicillin-binding protein 3)|nr:PASTA domain-containing protein [Deltaproteobacteria bacterium]
MNKKSGNAIRVLAPSNGGAPAESGKNASRSRMFLVAVVFLLLSLLLWSRFFNLQVIQGPEFARMAERQHNTGETYVGQRGSILDRNGNVLASSVETYSLSARLSEIGDIKESSSFLAKTLNRGEDKIRAILARDKRGFVWVQWGISDRQAKSIAESGLPGLYLHREQERVYPYKHLAGQLLGFAGRDNYGLEGLEASFDERLSGRAIRRTVRRDAGGRRVYLGGSQDRSELRGEDLQLTIDLHVQFFAETAIAKTVLDSRANWGGCLVIDVKSGDILAWAHYPFVNPNTYAAYPANDRRNKLAMDALEHGSTVKPFAIAAALQEKLVTPDTVYDCENGSWEIHGKVIRDTRPHKELTVKQILLYSSNIGAGKIGLALGAKTYGSYLHKLGFGLRTELPLVGENPGIMRNPNKWPEVDLASSAFGQSFSATTLQMAQAYLCLANFGERKPLQLLLDKTLRSSPKAEKRVFSAETSAQMLSMLKSVVHEDDGGGRFARIPGLEIGGKTGTAQKAEKGIYGDKRVASFVGMVPADKPEYLVLVVVDEPFKNRYGASSAAPVFKEVTMKTLAYFGHLPDPSLATLAGLTPENALTFDPTEYAQSMARQDALLRSRSYLPEQEEGLRGRREVKEALQPKAEPKSSIRTVPDVRGMDMRQAVEIFAVNGVLPRILGKGAIVDRQTPPPGTPWPDRASLAVQSVQAQDFVLWLIENY